MACRRLWALVPQMVRGAGAAVRPAVRPVAPRVAPPCAAASGAAGFGRAAPVLRFPSLAALDARLPIAAGRLWGGAAGGEHRRALSAPAAETGRGPTSATVFAVAEIGGKQYKVTVDDSIVTENMVGRRVGKAKEARAAWCASRCFSGNTAPATPLARLASTPRPLPRDRSLPDSPGPAQRALTRWRCECSPGETVVFDKVMLVGDKGSTTGAVLRVPRCPGSGASLPAVPVR